MCMFVIYFTEDNSDIKGHLLVIYYVPGTVLAENLTPFVVFDILRAQWHSWSSINFVVTVRLYLKNKNKN